MDTLTKTCKECYVKVKAEPRRTEGSTFTEVTLTGTDGNVKRALHKCEKNLGLVSVCRLATCVLVIYARK